MKIPRAYVCPLSGKIMDYPWVAGDGFSYEKELLQQFRRETKAVGKPLVSPMTSQIMDDVMVPNHLLRSMIQSWKYRHGSQLARRP